MLMTCGARAPSNLLAGWGAARHHCGAGHESRINPNNLRQVRGSIFFLFASCVVCWWHEVWAPFQGRRTTLSLRSLGRENCFAVTGRCFLRTKSEKLFPSRPSFLRRRTSTGLTLYRRIFQLLEGSSLAFALKEQYINNYKRYHHVRHTVGKVFSLRIQRQKVLRKTFSNA